MVTIFLCLFGIKDREVGIRDCVVWIKDGAAGIRDCVAGICSVCGLTVGKPDVTWLSKEAVLVFVFYPHSFGLCGLLKHDNKCFHTSLKRG